MKKLLVCCMVLFAGLSSCKKGSEFDPEKQAVLDEQKISKFIDDNALVVEKHSSGLHYTISDSGSGTIVYNANTSVTVKYTGRLLNGNVFESSTIKYPIGGLIVGWQIGLQLIQKGGKIRLLIPSGLAYGPEGIGNIPPNAVLDFDIELLEVTN